MTAQPRHADNEDNRDVCLRDFQSRSLRPWYCSETLDDLIRADRRWLHGVRQPVYKYLYGAIESDELGAAHGAEVGAVWYRDGMDVSDLPARQAVADPKVARQVHGVWVSFIRDEVPTTPAGDWPRHAATDAQVLHMADGKFVIVTDPFDTRTSLWQMQPV